MNKELKRIIKEEVYKVMMEMGEVEPIQLSHDMVKSGEEQVKSLEDELRYRESDARASHLPKEEKDARKEVEKLTKDRLEIAKKELEMAKQSEINAVRFSQMQTQVSAEQGGQSQIQSQI